MKGAVYKNMAITTKIQQDGRERFLKGWKKSHGTDYIHRCADGCGRQISMFMVWCSKCSQGKRRIFVDRFH